MHNSDRDKRIVIWGAGKIGRGFVADLFSAAGYALTFVDADEDLVASLRERRRYTLIKLPADAQETHEEIAEFEALPTSDMNGVDEQVATAPLIAVAVFPSLFDAVATELARGIERRAQERPEDPLDIVLCANIAHPAKEFAPLLHSKLSPTARDWVERRVGLAETVVLRIGIPPAEQYLAQDPLAVVTNGYSYLPVDITAFRGDFPEVPGLTPTDQIEAEETRKLYCHNMAHAALGYGGYLKGYTFVSEAGKDPEIAEEVQGALNEVARGLALEYSFSTDEMESFTAGILSYLSNPALPDTVARVGGDPKRKLRRTDRLIGPALMCRKHGVTPYYLMRNVAKAFMFGAGPSPLSEDPSAGEVQKALRLNGIGWCLRELCGLHEEEDLQEITRKHFAELLDSSSPKSAGAQRSEN